MRKYKTVYNRKKDDIIKIYFCVSTIIVNYQGMNDDDITYMYLQKYRDVISIISQKLMDLWKV